MLLKQLNLTTVHCNYDSEVFSLKRLLVYVRAAKTARRALIIFLYFDVVAWLIICNHICIVLGTL